jgi:hypothetical protein
VPAVPALGIAGDEEGRMEAAMAASTGNPPPVTPELRERARQSPGCWVYPVDPAFQDIDDVPDWAVIGAYRVDESGEIGEEFTPNPNYRPSPIALGFAAPANVLEEAMQKAVTGHGGAGDVRAALRDATVFTPFTPGRDGLIVLDQGLGRSVVHAFTSELYLPDVEVWRHWERLQVREIAPLLGERYLVLNPESPIELRVACSDLA